MLVRRGARERPTRQPFRKLIRDSLSAGDLEWASAHPGSSEQQRAEAAWQKAREVEDAQAAELEAAHAASSSVFHPVLQVIIDLSAHARTDPELRAALEPIERFAGHTSTPLGRAAFGVADDPALDDMITLVVGAVRGMQLLEPKRRINHRWSLCREFLLEVVTTALTEWSIRSTL
jgi:hypothetical protein